MLRAIILMLAVSGGFNVVANAQYVGANVNAGIGLYGGASGCSDYRVPEGVQDAIDYQQELKEQEKELRRAHAKRYGAIQGNGREPVTRKLPSSIVLTFYLAAR